MGFLFQTCTRVQLACAESYFVQKWHTLYSLFFCLFLLWWFFGACKLNSVYKAYFFLEATVRYSVMELRILTPSGYLKGKKTYILTRIYTRWPSHICFCLPLVFSRGFFPCCICYVCAIRATLAWERRRICCFQAVLLVAGAQKRLPCPRW